MFYENDAGVDERSKFRIRAYNCQRDIINLEIKSKHNGCCHKDFFKLDENLFWKLLRQFPVTYERTYNKTMNRFYLESATHLLRPAVIVEYERTALVYPVGNVRVTFDRNIASSKEYDRFFDTDLQVTPILPVNQHILEVKYDEVLPVYLEQLLDLGNLRQCTFSKYYMARQLELQK